MQFNQFIILLKKGLQKPLPGIDAQLKLTPYSRRTRTAAFQQDENPKLSAVLALIYPKKEVPHILLTLRNTYKGVHSNQVSFPGGKQEKTDLNFEHTALRETQEEVGVLSQNIEIIGKLTTVYIPPSRFLVHPFVGISTQEIQFRHDEREVNKIIEFPVSLLLDDTTIKESTIHNSIKKTTYKTPSFIIDEHIVWGATAMMLSELKTILLHTEGIEKTTSQ